ncbi:MULTISPECIES: oxidoreductase-like domain-containing protein [Thalassotalea]|uniref:Oxidoreductase-like domain-containing protein n=1 Tax=Thalassotalea castellviae TaxID=3075612 RepID=A0ABU3A544_9GAMM|nr:oxidoreductase-like domain-containing protein [Thalassotalea sp. W431]MDT0604998.1 oxidoreductase-like domain-containing protein [Thalassotalea sp. W431]
MSELLEKPQPPAEGECCDRACTPCVWDLYYAERKKWRLQQVELQEKAANQKDDD